MGGAAIVARRILVDADDAAAARSEARHGGAAHGAEADDDYIECHYCVFLLPGGVVLAMLSNQAIAIYVRKALVPQQRLSD
jgi:hypothetical protein